MAEQAKELVTALLALFDELSTQRGYFLEKNEEEVTLYVRVHKVISLELAEPVEDSALIVWLEDLRETTGLSFGSIVWGLTGKRGFGWVKTRGTLVPCVVSPIVDVITEEPDPSRVCEGLKSWLDGLIKMQI